MSKFRGIFGTHFLSGPEILWPEARIRKHLTIGQRLHTRILPVIAAFLILSISLNAEPQATSMYSSIPTEEAETASTYTIVASGDSYAVVTGTSLTMSGSSAAAAKIRGIVSKIHVDYIWFERAGKSFIINDPMLLDQAKSLVKPQQDLTRRQAEIGEQQARLGREQTRLGQIEAKEGNPDILRDLSSIRSELKRLRSQEQELPQDERAKIRLRIVELNKLVQIKSPAGEEQIRLAEQQSRLAEQQSELANQQTRLSETTSGQMTIMIDTALKNGQAKPSKRGKYLNGGDIFQLSRHM